MSNILEYSILVVYKSILNETNITGDDGTFLMDFMFNVSVITMMFILIHKFVSRPRPALTPEQFRLLTPAQRSAEIARMLGITDNVPLSLDDVSAPSTPSTPVTPPPLYTPLETPPPPYTEEDTNNLLQRIDNFNRQEGPVQRQNGGSNEEKLKEKLKKRFNAMSWIKTVNGTLENKPDLLKYYINELLKSKNLQEVSGRKRSKNKAKKHAKRRTKGKKPMAKHGKNKKNKKK